MVASRHPEVAVAEAIRREAEVAKSQIRRDLEEEAAVEEAAGRRHRAVGNRYLVAAAEAVEEAHRLPRKLLVA